MTREELVLSWARNAGTDIAVLSGNIVNPVDSSASWQDVAGTLATNLKCIEMELHGARNGFREREFITSLYDAFLKGMGASE